MRLRHDHDPAPSTIERRTMLAAYRVVQARSIRQHARRSWPTWLGALIPLGFIVGAFVMLIVQTPIRQPFSEAVNWVSTIPVQMRTLMMNGSADLGLRVQTLTLHLEHAATDSPNPLVPAVMEIPVVLRRALERDILQQPMLTISDQTLHDLFTQHPWAEVVAWQRRWPQALVLNLRTRPPVALRLHEERREHGPYLPNARPYDAALWNQQTGVISEVFFSNLQQWTTNDPSLDRFFLQQAPYGLPIIHSEMKPEDLAVLMRVWRRYSVWWSTPVVVGRVDDHRWEWRVVRSFAPDLIIRWPRKGWEALVDRLVQTDGWQRLVEGCAVVADFRASGSLWLQWASQDDQVDQIDSHNANTKGFKNKKSTGSKGVLKESSLGDRRVRGDGVSWNKMEASDSCSWSVEK